MQELWKSIFKKIVRMYIKWYLPLANKIGNSWAHARMSQREKDRVVSNMVKIEKANTFIKLKSLIVGNYLYTPDGVGGFPDWNQDMTTFLGRGWKGDCDAFATNTLKMFEDAGLVNTSRVVSILPISFRHWKRMHVVAEITLKDSPEDFYILSSGSIQKRPLSSYLKKEYHDVGTYIVVDYYTGDETNV